MSRFGRAPGGEAGFSAAPFTKTVSSFDRNDGSLVWECFVPIASP
jgi:hypothetical protein